MSSTYSNSLRIELIGNGDQSGTWGATTNSSLSNILDTAIAGYITVSVVAANQALTQISGATPISALNQSVYAMLRFTTTTGAAFNVYAPPVSKQYIVWNNSGYAMTIYNSTVIGNTTAAGTGITVANGDKIMVWSDGTNFYDLQAQNLTSTLPIAKGGTGQVTANAAFNALAPAQTNNRVLRSNGTDTSFAQVALATDVSGTLPIANGGTAQTSFTANYIHYGSFSTSAGLIYNGTDFTCGGNVTAYSDERVKTNWRDLPADFIEQLAKVKHGIYDRTDQEATQVGVSAQSLQPVMPNAVIEDDGKLSVAYGNAALVAAIKLAERVIALEARLDALTKE